MKFYAPASANAVQGALFVRKKSMLRCRIEQYAQKKTQNLVKPDGTKKPFVRKMSAFRANYAPPHDSCGMVGLQKKRNLRTGCPSDEGGEHMFEITRLTVEHLAAGCVTDCSTPRIGFSLSSDRRGRTVGRRRVDRRRLVRPCDQRPERCLRRPCAAAVHHLQRAPERHRRRRRDRHRHHYL